MILFFLCAYNTSASQGALDNVCSHTSFHSHLTESAGKSSANRRPGAMLLLLHRCASQWPAPFLLGCYLSVTVIAYSQRPFRQVIVTTTCSNRNKTVFHAYWSWPFGHFYVLLTPCSWKDVFSKRHWKFSFLKLREFTFLAWCRNNLIF